MSRELGASLSTGEEPGSASVPGLAGAPRTHTPLPRGSSAAQGEGQVTPPLPARKDASFPPTIFLAALFFFFSLLNLPRSSSLEERFCPEIPEPGSLKGVTAARSAGLRLCAWCGAPWCDALTASSARTTVLTILWQGHECCEVSLKNEGQEIVCLHLGENPKQLNHGFEGERGGPARGRFGIECASGVPSELAGGTHGAAFVPGVPCLGRRRHCLKLLVTAVWWAAVIEPGDTFALWKEVGPSPSILPLSPRARGAAGAARDPVGTLMSPACHTRAARRAPELCTRRVLARRRRAEGTS